MRIAIAAALVLAALSSPLLAQSPAPKPAPKPAENKAAEKAAPKAAPKATSIAKQLFGAAARPAPLAARAIGFYAKGCLSGALALPVDGKTWQVMRLTRNRNWAHPNLIRFLEQFSAKVPRLAGWPGILVGDLSQPRGGPMLTGHTSHQVGLDADIWLTPMPDRTLSREERETISATMMVRTDRRDIDPAAWTPSHLKVVRAAAEDPAVERIFVNAAIKKALCREAGAERAWLNKLQALLGPRLPHAHPHQVPGRQSRVQAAGSGRARRRLRQGSRLLVQRLDSLSEAAGNAAQAKAGPHHGRSAAVLPAGAARALRGQFRPAGKA